MGLLLLIVGIVAVVWFFNFDKPVKQLADMANREVSIQNAMHKAKAVKKMQKLDLKDEDVVKAKANLAALDSFDL